MIVREYRPGDEGAISDLFRRSVKGLGLRDYSAKQVESWAARAPDPSEIRTINQDGRLTLLAVDETDQPLAFIDLEYNGHIDYLYAAPEVAGTGLAGRLYDKLEEIARKRRCKRLYTEASEAARRLFLRKGFEERHKRDLEIDGVAIHNYAMEKWL